MRFTFKYTNYPLSPELTKKSQLVGRLTHPMWGVMLGGVLILMSANLFPNSTSLPLILGVAGIIAGPILLVQIRKKKFAQYDAEYEKILQASRK